MFPEDPKKTRAKIKRYERLLKKEYEEHGFYRDGYGKRYLLGPLYMLMGDIEGAVSFYDWFEKTFPLDTGDIGQSAERNAVAGVGGGKGKAARERGGVYRCF